MTDDKKQQDENSNQAHFNFEPSLPWLSSIPKNARYNAFAIGFLLMFLSFFLFNNGVANELVYIVVGSVFLLILLIVLLPYFLTHKENPDTYSEELTTSTTKEYAHKLELINSKIKSLEDLIEPVIKDFESVKEIAAHSAIYNSSYSDLLTLAKLKYLKRDFKGSVITLNLLKEQEPENSRVFSNLSYAHEGLGDIERACENMEKAICFLGDSDPTKLSMYQYHYSRYLYRKYKDSNNREILDLAVAEFKKIRKPSIIERAMHMEEYSELIQHIYESTD